MPQTPFAFSGEPRRLLPPDPWVDRMEDLDLVSKFAVPDHELVSKLQIAGILSDQDKIGVAEIRAKMTWANLALISGDDFMESRQTAVTGKQLLEDLSSLQLVNAHNLVLAGLAEKGLYDLDANIDVDAEKAVADLVDSGVVSAADFDRLMLDAVASGLDEANVVFIRPKIDLKEILGLTIGDLQGPATTEARKAANDDEAFDLTSDYEVTEEAVEEAIVVVRSRLEQTLDYLESKPEVLYVRHHVERVLKNLDTANIPRSQVLMNGFTALAGLASLALNSGSAQENVSIDLQPLANGEPVVEVAETREFTITMKETAPVSPEILEKIRTYRQGFERLGRDRALDENSVKIVVGDDKGRTRHAYLHDYFLSEGETDMPDEIRQRLARVIPGLAAQESVYDNNAISHSGAMAVLQIMKPAYGDYVNRNRSKYKSLTGREIVNLRHSLRLQTEVALYHFGVIHRHLESKIDYEAIGEKYGLDEKALNDFRVWTMVNAYNAGQGRMVKVIKRFQSRYDSVEDLPEPYDHTGLSLFNALSEYGYNHDGLRQGGYGKDASQYVLKVLSGAEALNDRFDTQYGLNLELTTPPPHTSQ